MMSSLVIGDDDGKKVRAKLSRPDFSNGLKKILHRISRAGMTRSLGFEIRYYTRMFEECWYERTGIQHSIVLAALAS